MPIRAYVSDDSFGGFTVRIALVIEQENEQPMLIRLGDGLIGAVEAIEPGTILEPTLTLPADHARALLDGLTRHYRGAEDTRALRRDYDAERARVDKLTGALIAITAPRAQHS